MQAARMRYATMRVHVTSHEVEVTLHDHALMMVLQSSFLIRYAYLLDTRYCDWALLLFSG